MSPQSGTWSRASTDRHNGDPRVSREREGGEAQERGARCPGQVMRHRQRPSPVPGEVAEPLGLEFYTGDPSEIPESPSTGGCIAD